MDQQNQQQPVQQPVQPAPAKPKFDLVEIIAKVLPILVIVFLGLAVIALLYYFILGIIAWAQTGRFIQFFVNGLQPAVQRVGFNVFAAAVLAALSKIIKK